MHFVSRQPTARSLTLCLVVMLLLLHGIVL